MENQLSKQEKLDLRYLRMARIWAENSYCKRRQVGALVVKDKMIISDGYNGTPSPSWLAAATIATEVLSTSPPRHVSNVLNSSSSLVSSALYTQKNIVSTMVSN